MKSSLASKKLDNGCVFLYNKEKLCHIKWRIFFKLGFIGGFEMFFWRCFFVTQAYLEAPSPRELAP